MSNCPRTVPILGETLVQLWAGDEEGGDDDDGWFAAYEFEPSLNRCLMLKGKGVLRPRLLLRPTT